MSMAKPFSLEMNAAPLLRDCLRRRGNMGERPQPQQWNSSQILSGKGAVN